MCHHGMLTIQLTRIIYNVNLKNMPNTKIIIYSTPFCGYCKLVKEYLDKNKIAYQEIDVSQDKSVQEEMIAKSGQTGVPVIIIKKDDQEEILIGFQKNKLAEILNIK